MVKYEIMYLFSPKILEKEIKQEISKANEEIKKLGGEITKEEFLGLKELAYPIKHFNQGYYHVTWLRLARKNVEILNKKLQLMPTLLRFLLSQIVKEPLAQKEKKEVAPASKEEMPPSTLQVTQTKEEKIEPKAVEKKVSQEVPETPKKERKRDKRTEKADLDDLDKKLDEILGEEVL